MVTRATLGFLLVACDASAPRTACSELAAVPDLETLANDDWRASIFADERDAWLSPRCDATRRALRPLDDHHDLEEATVKKECEDAASHDDLACRAGCFAQRRHDALVAGWARAIRDVRAFAPPLDYVRLEKECRSPTADERTAQYLRCLGLPALPKAFRITAQGTSVPEHEGNVSWARTTGLDAVLVERSDGRAVREVFFTQCASPSRWGTFYRVHP